MTPAQARAAVSSHFATQWGNETPINWDNDRKPVNGDHVAFSFVHNGFTDPTMGDVEKGPVSLHRMGYVFVQVFASGGTGTARADALAERAAAMLDVRTIGGVTLGAAGIKEVGSDPLNGLHQVNVSVPFSYFEVRAPSP